MKVLGYVSRSAEGKSWDIENDLDVRYMGIRIIRTGTHRVMRKSDYAHKQCYPQQIPVFRLEDYLAEGEYESSNI